MLERARNANLEEEELRTYEDYVVTLQTIKKLPQIREVVSRIQNVIDSAKYPIMSEQQSLDEPSSDDAKEESA